MPWKRFIRKTLIISFCVILPCVASYVAFVAYKSQAFYDLVKSKGKLTSENIIESHPELGFAPRPNSTGASYFALPPSTPLAYDHLRCRIPATGIENESEEWTGPIVLALGCSFTHGDGCLAEETYGALVAESLNAKLYNAGYSAYGLSQMLIRARELIPLLQPDYVIVQYSSWLSERSISQFAPTRITYRPQPYFYQEEAGKPEIQPPVWSANTIAYPIARFRDTERSWRDFALFVGRVTLPQYTQDTMDRTLYNAKKSIGVFPEPMRDAFAVTAYAYGEIAALCQTIETKLYVPIIGAPGYEPDPDEIVILEKVNGLTLVDTWSAVRDQIPNSSPREMLWSFGQVRGNPPILIDPHPNPGIHKIMADVIKQKINLPETTP